MQNKEDPPKQRLPFEFVRDVFSTLNARVLDASKEAPFAAHQTPDKFHALTQREKQIYELCLDRIIEDLSPDKDLCPVTYNDGTPLSEVKTLGHIECPKGLGDAPVLVEVYWDHTRSVVTQLRLYSPKP